MFVPSPHAIYVPYGSPEFLYGLSESIARRLSENRDYGSKLTYDPSWTGPLNVKRSMTGIPGLVIFFLLFIYWVVVAYYAFMFGDLKKFFTSTSDSDPSRYLSSSVNDLYNVRWIIIVILLIAVLSSFLYLVLLSNGAEATIYISFLLRVTMMVLAISWFIYLLVEMSWEKEWDLDEIWFLSRNIFMVVILVVSLFLMLIELTQSKGLNCEIIQELTKAVVFFPSLFIYSLLVYTILFAMAGVCIAVQWSLQSIDGLPESYLIINYIIEILCLIWFNCFLSAFLKLIASGSYATWYWTRNKQEVPKITTMRFIGITLRYYISTSTFGSCIMPVNEGTAKAYMMLHGTSFFESARISNNLLHRNRRAKQIYEEICCEWMLSVISIVSVLCILYKAVLLITFTEEFQSSWAQLLACFIIFRTVYWMLDLLQVAIDTIFICILEDFEVNGNSDRPHYMSDKLKVLIPNPQTEQ